MVFSFLKVFLKSEIQLFTLSLSKERYTKLKVKLLSKLRGKHPKFYLKKKIQIYVT